MRNIRGTLWQCNNKFKNVEKCDTPHLYEDTLKEAFLEAFNSLIKNRDEILQGYESILQALTDTSKLDKESIAVFMRELEHRDGLVAEFNEEFWNATIENVLVHSKHVITFVFKDGMELDWNI